MRQTQFVYPFSIPCLALLFCVLATPEYSDAGTIYATGQLLIPGDPSIPPGQPGHDDTRENYVYHISTLTGLATPVSPVTTGLPAALAGTLDGRLLGFAGGQLSEVSPSTGVLTPIGASNGLTATGLEVLPDNRGFLTPFDANFDSQQLFSLDITTGAAAPISGSPTEIGDAIDNAAGNPLGTTRPFIIGLGAVADQLYGVDLDSNSLIALDADNGAASVVGDVGAVGSVTNGSATYGGFAALTGVDENADGEFDALFGAVNFIDDGNENQRLGGVARSTVVDVGNAASCMFDRCDSGRPGIAPSRIEGRGDSCFRAHGTLV